MKLRAKEKRLNWFNTIECIVSFIIDFGVLSALTGALLLGYNKRNIFLMVGLTIILTMGIAILLRYLYIEIYYKIKLNNLNKKKKASYTGLNVIFKL